MNEIIIDSGPLIALFDSSDKYHSKSIEFIKNNRKIIGPLPDRFASEEKAGEFWDTHSTSDYEEYLEPVDVTIDIKKRHFEIEIDRDSFIALNKYAKIVNKPLFSR